MQFKIGEWKATSRHSSMVVLMLSLLRSEVRMMDAQWSHTWVLKGQMFRR